MQIRKGDQVTPHDRARPRETTRDSRPANPTPRDREPTHAEVAECAYFLWEQQGGDAASNWLEAERACRARAGVPHCEKEPTWARDRQCS
jgi:hypothetical protein